jgi:uncharacterized protein (DUF433 family)
MQLEEYFEFLGSENHDPQCSTAIRIKGHRIGIEHVLAYYKSGYSPDEIAREFPGLGLEKIHATITYYLSHRAAVEHYLRRIRDLDEQAYQEWAAAGPSPLVQRLLAWREAQYQEQPQ